MNISLRFIKTSLIAGLLALAIFGASFGSVFAQTQEDALRATIRAAILSDSRSFSMTEAEIDAMVIALARQAESVGMTAEDIVWRPTEEGATQAAPVACDGFLCSLNNAFGFDGSDYTIPIMLGASALMLIFIIAGLLEYRHLHHKKMREQAGNMQQPVNDGMQQ